VLNQSPVCNCHHHRDITLEITSGFRASREFGLQAAPSFYDHPAVPAE
jgi:hypothetical protein